MALYKGESELKRDRRIIKWVNDKRDSTTLAVAVTAIATGVLLFLVCIGWIKAGVL